MRPKRHPPSSRSEIRDQVEARSKIWCERGGELVLSEWRLDLLAAVGETGSLSRAAERLDVPYRTAWHKLKAVEEHLGVRLLETFLNS